ncbi:histidine phosphatase superfamily [Syncephalis plumigaleata]|nr:histidine phosphatase superfamily [Syncephalis plumigaleata]
MELTKRLGFSVTFKVYEYMILACSFEFAIKGHANGWCELLLDEDASRNDHYSVDPYSVESRALELHDFLQDIRFYHRYGLGKPLNARISCVLILQLLREMQEAVHGNLSTRWRLRFAHAETVLLLLTNLGINTDKPEFRRDRSLRASRLIPFAANMHFELLSCSSTPGTTQDEQYFVRVLLNEHPLQIPGCTDKEALCSWAQFQRIVQTHAGDCNYNAMCAAQ